MGPDRFANQTSPRLGFADTRPGGARSTHVRRIRGVYGRTDNSTSIMSLCVGLPVGSTLECQRERSRVTSQFHDSERDAEVYRSVAPELVRYANSLVGPTDAADVVSAAVLKAFTSRGWPQVENHRAYLYKAVLNEVRSQHRSTMRRRARELKTANPESTTMPEVRPEVLEALSRLSTRQRAVAYLTYFEDLDEATVGERLGISTGSVRRHLGRARDKLREMLDA